MQEGFWEEHGLQCGYLHTGHDHDRRGIPRNAIRIPTDDEIRHALEGNLCRCTGYQNIVKAIQYAAKKG